MSVWRVSGVCVLLVLYFVGVQCAGVYVHPAGSLALCIISVAALSCAAISNRKNRVLLIRLFDYGVMFWAAVFAVSWILRLYRWTTF